MSTSIQIQQTFTEFLQVHFTLTDGATLWSYYYLYFIEKQTYSDKLGHPNLNLSVKSTAPFTYLSLSNYNTLWWLESKASLHFQPVFQILPKNISPRSSDTPSLPSSPDLQNPILVDSSIPSSFLYIHLHHYIVTW